MVGGWRGCNRLCWLYVVGVFWVYGCSGGRIRRVMLGIVMLV